MDRCSEVIINHTQETDLEAILEISKSHTLSNINDIKKASQNGFLVSEFTLEDYQQFYHEAEYFFVAKVEEKVVGFLLAYNSESIKSGEVVNSLLKYNLVEPFVLIKQIGVDSDFMRKGIASKLYKHIVHHVKERGFAAAIVNEPINTSSLDFHKRLGFRHLCNIQPPADKDSITRSRSIWYRTQDDSKDNIPQTRLCRAEQSDNIEQLMGKFDTAISLYTHEDNLNWTKFGLLISFMMALFAAFSFIWEKGDDTIYLIMGATVIGFGFLINYIFAEKIKSGLMFMQSHKEKAKYFESKIYWLNADLSPILNIDNQRISGSSKTVQLMQYIPIISYIIWTGCSVLLILKKMNLIH